MHNPSFKLPLGRVVDALRSHSLENFSDKEEMRHQITAVPLVEKSKMVGEGGKGVRKMKSGGVVEKIKKVAKKVKDVAEVAGKAIVKEAKKHSHHLIEAGKHVGGMGGAAAGLAAAETVGPLGVPAGKFVGEKVGEAIGRKLHEGIQSLKKGGKVKLQQITDTKPEMQMKKTRKPKMEVVEAVEVIVAPKRSRKAKEPKAEAPAKKSSAWMDHVKAHHAKHGGSYKDAMKAAKATYKK
jgi:hypothetical protein